MHDYEALLMDFREWMMRLPEMVTSDAQRLSQTTVATYLPQPASVGRYFDKLAPFGASLFSKDLRLTLMQLLLRTSPAGTVVSFGSGIAIMELYLLYRGVIDRAILVDCSGAMIARAMRLADDLGVAPKIETVIGDVSQTKFKPNSADLVMAVGSLEWPVRWQRWIALAMETAKLRGQILLASPVSSPNGLDWQYIKGRALTAACAVYSEVVLNIPAGSAAEAVQYQYVVAQKVKPL